MKLTGSAVEKKLRQHDVGAFILFSSVNFFHLPISPLVKFFVLRFRYSVILDCIPVGFCHCAEGDYFRGDWLVFVLVIPGYWNDLGYSFSNTS